MPWREEAIMRLRYLVILSAIVVAAPLAVYLSQKPGGDQLNDTLWDLGFIPRTPPTTLMTVGSIYYIQPDGTHFHPICIAGKDDVGEAVRKSGSIELQQQFERKGQAAAGASFDIGWLLKGDFGDKYVVKVNYSLTDVQVEEIPLGINSEVYHRLMDHPECSKMANQYLRAAGYVCQVASILSATAEFKMDSESKLSTSSNEAASEVKDLMKQAVEAQAKQEVVSKEGRLLAGKALQYGAMVTPMCMAPATARFARTVPSTRFGRIWNYVLFNIVEPILPKQADEAQAPPGV
jgi:hypothetical protein